MTHQDLPPRAALVVLVVLLGAASGARAADPNKSHPHQGELKPYPEEPLAVPLSEAERASMLAGAPVFKKTEGETGGRGVAVFRVNAPPDVVWGVLKSFEQYPKWVDNLDESEVYLKKGERIDVRMKISALGVTAEYFVTHKFREANKYATWTLDYARESDFGDTVGFWKVDEVPGDPSSSVVTYSVDLVVRGWVPGFIRTLLVDSGIKKATQWVKVVSEKRAAERKARAAAP